jgi:16S rRNA (adenine1518-N6/adenine1519-N6)-dimethyltransferase
MIFKKSMEYQKKLGQNFLINKKALKKIVAFLNISQKNIIVEIGAGSGNLTEELLKKEALIIAIEKDEKLIKRLEERFSNYLNKDNKKLEIIKGDVREILPLISKKLKNYKIVGNIPYYLTNHLFYIFQQLKNPPQLIVLTIQKEVAERIVAKPPKANQLGNIINLWAKPKILFNLKAKDFFPQPKVASSVIKLEIKPFSQRLKNEEEIIKLIKIGFKQPRKVLMNNLSEKFDKNKIKNVFKKLNLDEKIRPAELSLEMWITINKMLNY